MKKNLIIIVFCLFMLGTFCFNYSYAKTVTRTDAYCKKSFEQAKEWAIQATKESYEDEIAQFRRNNNRNRSEMNDLQQTQINNLSQSEWEKAACESIEWCYYIWSKCLSCDGIKLNTNVPFIWNCIPSDSQSEAFPLFIGGLIKFAMSLLMLAGFVCILIWWVMFTAWKTTEWKNLIMKVVRALAALWASWIILKIINPNFFS